MNWKDFFKIRRYEDIMNMDPPNRKPSFVVCDAAGFPVPQGRFPGYESREEAENAAQEFFKEIEAGVDETLLCRKP